jgi:DNA gyrase subunit A
MKKNNEKNKELNEMTEVDFSTIIKKEYKAYQIYSLLDRAIPYLNDGLKPSQRRILYTLYKNKDQKLIKVSSATGLVLSLHPHGPASIESSITNMAQDFVFSNNYPLIAKKGYFGERMEQSPAAGRYIECRLQKFTELLLFDDMNQVKMVPNFDEKTVEPEFLLPKLPIMLLNGSEGIGTGHSSIIPSFHHKDLIDSMVSFIKTGKIKKLKPFINGYKNNIIYDKDKNRFIFEMAFEKINGKYYITELPKGFDSAKIYKHLSKLIDEDFIKDYTDESVDNNIKIELIFKKGFNPRLDTVINKVNVQTTLVPNYTLIAGENSETMGVKIFNNPEEILEEFTKQRLQIVRNRYLLLQKDAEERILKNNEIIRFIKEQHYTVAEHKKDRGEYISYLKNKKFIYFEYLADMAIYRMTKDEVAKRQLLINDDKKVLAEYKDILKAKNGVELKLIDELELLDKELSDFLKKKAQTDRK